MASQVEEHNRADIEEPLLVRLLLTLEEMIKRYQKLLPVLQQEKTLMIEGNLKDLMPCLSQKEGLLAELRQLEEQRVLQIDPLEKRFRTPDASQASYASRGKEGMTLRQLIDWVSVPYRERLLSCYDRLRALSASVAEINQINGLLIGRILQQVNALLGLLTHLSAAPATYQASGFLSRDVQGGRFFRSNGSFHIRG